MQKSILLIIAPEGYQKQEYLDTRHTLEDNGYTVVTASTRPGRAVAHTVQLGVINPDNSDTAPIDMLIKNVSVDNHAGIFIIGGPGTLDHLSIPAVYNVMTEAFSKNIVHGAICIAPRILAATSILTGKQATGWNADGSLETLFASTGCEYIPKPVVVDDLLITAEGPHAAREFGQAIVSALKKR